MFKIFKFIIPLVLIGFLAQEIISDWTQIAQYWQNFDFRYLFLMFLVTLTIYPEGAFSWHILLGKIGLKRSLEQVFRIWIISNTSRYIPGMIWQYIGRVELGQREANIDRKSGVASVLLEAFFTLVGAILISLLALPYLKITQLGSFWWIFFILPVLFLIHPTVSFKIITILARFKGYNFKNLNFHLGLSDSIIVAGWYGFNFILNGFALALLSSSFGAVSFDIGKVFVFAAFYSLAWLIGYLSIFAPGGIGVTEVSLAYFLSFFMQFSLASVIALSYRFFLTVAELFMFLLALRIKK